MIQVGDQKYPDENMLPSALKQLQKGMEGAGDRVRPLRATRAAPASSNTDGTTVSDLVDNFLKSEWTRLQDDLSVKLGTLQLSAAVEAALRERVCPPKLGVPPVERLNLAFSNSKSLSVPSTDNPGLTAAQSEEGLEKLKTGSFSSLDELSSTILQSKGVKSTSRFTSAVLEPTLVGRPEFSSDTEKARQSYVVQAGKGPKETDLRHIISSTTFNKALYNCTDSLEDIKAFLKYNNASFSAEIGLPAAKVMAFELVHSHLGNLWPGGAANNQAAGSMHGMLNHDAIKQGQAMNVVPSDSTTTATTTSSSLSSDTRISECFVNKFLARVDAIDDAITERLRGEFNVDDEALRKVANAARDFNQSIAVKVGANKEHGYTAQDMADDLNEWLLKNQPAEGDHKLKEVALADLKKLCQEALNDLGCFQPGARVDECKLTTYLEKLRPRGEIPAEMKQAYEMTNTVPVLSDRQISQKAMVTACADYLQARSIACERQRDEKSVGDGYTQKIFADDLANLAANFDLDLPHPDIPDLKVESASEGYGRDLLLVEMALLDVKSGADVKLFQRGTVTTSDGQQRTVKSIMDRFVELDYKNSFQHEQTDFLKEKTHFKRKRGDDRSHDDMRQNAPEMIIPEVEIPDGTSTKRRPDPESKHGEDPMNVASSTPGRSEVQDPMNVASNVSDRSPEALPRTTSVGRAGNFNKCDTSQNSFEAMRQRHKSGGTTGTLKQSSSVKGFNQS